MKRGLNAHVIVRWLIRIFQLVQHQQALSLRRPQGPENRNNAERVRLADAVHGCDPEYHASAERTAGLFARPFDGLITSHETVASGQFWNRESAMPSKTTIFA